MESRGRRETSAPGEAHALPVEDHCPHCGQDASTVSGALRDAAVSGEGEEGVGGAMVGSGRHVKDVEDSERKAEGRQLTGSSPFCCCSLLFVLCLHPGPRLSSVKAMR